MGKIKAKIVSIQNGLQEFENVEMIRVVSEHHTLLIMQNYMPVIGELKGSVELVFEEYVLRFAGLKGFYMHKKNEFNLLVQEGDASPQKRQEE
ncbi:MAG: hypothetical protein MR355_00985 [Lachnospiraceae bacterium]|nr:hypothetical protein [Lachnospiraceae bacterium]